MKRYYKVMLGAKSVHAPECLRDNFIGVDFGIHQDLSSKLHENWREFNNEFIPIFMKRWPEKSKIAAGLACATIWVVSKGIKKGDCVLCPDGSGKYLIGEIEGDYQYLDGNILPHRRAVKWFDTSVERASFSDGLKSSTSSTGTYCEISKHAEEIESLIGARPSSAILTTDSTIEDPSVFALEKHLEDFLVQNWKHTELGKDYNIFEENGELVGQQYPSDTGPIDILAVSKDKRSILVVELKKGRASDNVVGQIQRYMGYVKEKLTEKNQQVKGVIIALEDDLRIKRALSVTNNIEFYRYEVSFKLFKN